VNAEKIYRTEMYSVIIIIIIINNS